MAGSEEGRTVSQAKLTGRDHGGEGGQVVSQARLTGRDHGGEVSGRKPGPTYMQ